VRVLDLYCCAGGAARGYQLAGATVYGVDIVGRPNYCGDLFDMADALEFLDQPRWMFHKAYDLIHASPPCQKGSTLHRGTNVSRGWGKDHEQLVPQTRELLDKIGLPYVIEQPTGHGGLIRTDLRLCMDMFPVGDPPWVQRHRDFEISGFTVPQPKHRKHRGYVRGMRHGVVREGPYVAAYGSGGGKATVPEMQHALGIDWTAEREELTEAIPPAYTRHIGLAFQAQLDACECSSRGPLERNPGDA
jgi:hypothetical protein